MLILGPIGFAVPWVLAALAALPALWVILRAMPPAPRQVKFPAVGLLLGLRDKAPVAHRTPWWLLLLRLAAVAALILAFAGPVWKPVQQSDGTGPLLVVLDAGWSAAPGWAQRQAQAERTLSDAAAAGRPAALLIADGRQDGPLTFHSGTELIAGLRAARPAPWPSIWPEETAALLAGRPAGALDSLWISDGLDGPQRETLLAALLSLGQVTVIPPSAPVQALSLAPPDAQQATGDPALIWHSLPGAPDGAVETAPVVLAIGPDPQGTERELARLVAGEVQTGGTDAISRPVPIDLPPELRNRITRFQIEGQSHAGAVVLADDRVRRHKVGLVGAADRTAEGQQLLSPLHYLRRALAPGADLVEGGLGDVLNAAPDVIILVDQIDMPEAGALAEWVDRGGLLIRFGGPRMAGSERLDDDGLLPVALRPGGRDIGGALSWGDPRGLAPFAADGIFAGLAQPEDVEIRAQLMAQPGPELAQRSIAALSDNTPLVTRAERGRGQIVLFHVTANAEWSNLPISGLFVQMLDRLIATAGPVAQAGAGEVVATQAGTDPATGIAVDLTFWAPQLVLDGFGRAEGPGDLAPVASDDLARGPAPGQPAGIYVAGDRQQALNAGGPLRAATWAGAVIRDPAAVPGRDLMGPLIALAAILLALDVIGSALLARGGRMATTAAALLALMLTAAPRADAQEINPELIRAADEVALAYVITGDEAIDQTSYDGLRGLSQALAGRSSVEPGLPVGINLDDDDLSVLTFLYWPITDSQPAPSPMAYVRLNHFLRSGGMILFDTRDGDIAGLGGPDTGAALQALAAPLDIPPLAPIPRDHVLTRAFYLLDDFPGRWSDPEIWVEAPRLNAEAEEGVPFRHLNDGVTPVVIGGNSWAEAWAIDDQGMSVFPVGRGFEGEQQREMAYRFGVNLIVYALTGNYKSDQVHVPALLERMRDEEVIQ